MPSRDALAPIECNGLPPLGGLNRSPFLEPYVLLESSLGGGELLSKMKNADAVLERSEIN